MIIHGTTKFISAPFSSEAELERVVQQNSEFIFGPESIFLPKSLIRTADGFGTIPDGFVVDLASRRWFIVEAELGSHSVWNHIAPQVAKQIIAATQPSSRRTLTELVVNKVKESSRLRDRFDDAGIGEIDIRQVLTEIFEKSPIVGIPIDNVGVDLRAWAQTQKTDVKLWIVRKLVEFGNVENVMYEIPDEYRPVLDTSPEAAAPTGTQYFSIDVAEVMSAGLLTEGQKLFMSYKPRGGERKQYEATILADGSLEVLGETFSAPSPAALLCMQDAGSDGNSVNGWTMWRTAEGKTLMDFWRLLRQGASRDKTPAQDTPA